MQQKFHPTTGEPLVEWSSGYRDGAWVKTALPVTVEAHASAIEREFLEDLRRATEKRENHV